MIQPSELRIGNIVWDDYFGLMVVTELAEDGLRLRHINGTVSGSFNYENINSVPLTTDLLKNNLGFEDKSVFHQYFKDNVSVIYYPKDGRVQINTVTSSFDGTVKSLHELQNAFFITVKSGLIYTTP